MTDLPMLRLLPLGLLAATAACRTNPAIPFQKDHWQFFVAGGRGAVKDDFVEQTNHLALDIVVPRENTAGWCHEVSLRISGGEGNGVRRMSAQEGGGSQPSERELDFREFGYGARQYYQQDSSLTPYVAAGLAVFRYDVHEDYVDTNGIARGNSEHDIEFGVYLRTGVLWNTLRDVFAEESEFKLGLDMRGLYATDYSTIEFALVLGIGK